VPDPKLLNAVYKAVERDAKNRQKERKKREQMLMRLGVVVDQMMKKGDPGFIDRFEAEARGCFPDEKRYSADREALGLDVDFSVFDSYRETRGLPRRLGEVLKPRDAQSLPSAPIASGIALRSASPSTAAEKSAAAPAPAAGAGGG
jgi:hypothetical protein